MHCNITTNRPPLANPACRPRHPQTPEFHEAWKLKARDVMARAEWRRRKLTKRVRDAGGDWKGGAGHDCHCPGLAARTPAATALPCFSTQPVAQCVTPLTPTIRPPHLRYAAQYEEEEARAKEEFKEERAAAKTKAKSDKAWEKTRDERVGSWRDFTGQKGGAKKQRTGGIKVQGGAGGVGWGGSRGCVSVQAGKPLPCRPPQLLLICPALYPAPCAPQPPKMKEQDSEKRYVQRPVGEQFRPPPMKHAGPQPKHRDD